jgi:hypothetical protein
MLSEKMESETASNLPEGSNQLDFENIQETMLSSMDHDLINELEEEIASRKEEIRNKLYAVSCTKDLFDEYETFIKEKAEWNSTEALGVVEISKQIEKIKKEGIKDNTIYLGALPLEASHYFLSKSRGRGLKEAQDFIKIYKAFDIALNDAKKDASGVKDLEKRLAAAMQGLDLA